jgi:hypothetical protein
MKFHPNTTGIWIIGNTYFSIIHGEPVIASQYNYSLPLDIVHKNLMKELLSTFNKGFHIDTFFSPNESLCAYLKTNAKLVWSKGNNIPMPLVEEIIAMCGGSNGIIMTNKKKCCVL